MQVGLAQVKFQQPIGPLLKIKNKKIAKIPIEFCKTCCRLIIYILVILFLIVKKNSLIIMEIVLFSMVGIQIFNILNNTIFEKSIQKYTL